MRAKLLTSALALAGVLTFATASQAQDPSNFLNGNNNSNEDSFNDNSEHSVEDSNNDNSDNSVEDSNNDNSEHSVEDSNNDNSDNSDNSTNHSNNDNSRHDTRISLSAQELNASVTGLDFNFDEEDDGGQNGRIRTGDIIQGGGSFAGFAGIQTVSSNTGVASIGQAATAVSANANITFGAD